MTARRKQRKKASEQKIVGALDMPKILSPSVPHIETEGNKEAVSDHYLLRQRPYAVFLFRRTDGDKGQYNFD